MREVGHSSGVDAGDEPKVRGKGGNVGHDLGRRLHQDHTLAEDTMAGGVDDLNKWQFEGKSTCYFILKSLTQVCARTGSSGSCSHSLIWHGKRFVGDAEAQWCS
jgi:hypothetical protein